MVNSALEQIFGPEGDIFHKILNSADPEVYRAIEGEIKRQCEGLELIASENFASPAVILAQASVMNNKYAEGLPGHRYYAGCEFVDVVENLAIERAKRLFQAEHVNVQPHSGSQANASAYLATLKPGETVLAMRLDHGGHLSHGSPVNFSGQIYKFCHYGVDKESELIDYDQVLAMAQEHRPSLIVAGASAYPRFINFQRLREVADGVGARLMVDMAHIAGLVAAGVHPTPIPHAQVVTTTIHKTLRGPRGGLVFCHSELAGAIDKAVFPGIQGGPLMHVIAAKAVALGEALRPQFKAYQVQIVANAKALAQGLQEEGLRLVSGGTDNHLILVDLQPAGISGREAEARLVGVGLTVNKNKIPYDPLPATETSGIRLGTPAVTTRGLKEKEMRAIAGLIGRMIREGDKPEVAEGVRNEVLEISSSFPYYAWPWK